MQMKNKSFSYNQRILIFNHERKDLVSSLQKLIHDYFHLFGGCETKIKMAAYADDLLKIVNVDQNLL